MALKIYTKTGDHGDTSLYGGARVSKDDIRIEAYGTVDELNAYLGLVSDGCIEIQLESVLNEIQNRLFTIGSNLASDPNKNMITPDLIPADIELLETEIDKMDNELVPLKNFILPGGHQLVSFCHLARTVCRRAERRVVTLSHESDVNNQIIVYLNRLSDYLFTLSRFISHRLKIEERNWHPRPNNS